MKRTLLSSLLAVALICPLSAPFAAETAVPVHTASSAAPDPAVEIRQLAQRFRAGDLTGLAQALVPPSKWEAARIAFDVQRAKPTTDAERARFAEDLQRLTAPDAVDRMVAKLEPQLAEARAKLPGMRLMASGAMLLAINSPETKLTDAQRAALRSALPGVQQWMNTTDFLSTDALRRALTTLADAAIRTGITDIDQLKALPLEGLVDRAAPMLAAGKDAARIYGLDLDAIADSLTVEVIERGADTARVRTTVTLFGAPVWAEHDLVLVEGHWYGKHVQAEFDGLADAGS